MKKSRRKVTILDASAWVFNRMADVYDARPAYPGELVDAIAELGSRAGRRVCDVGAGIGHLAVPLALRGFDVTAVEPAKLMLDRLGELSAQSGVTIRRVHAAAESLPLEAGSFDLVLIADALHFIDTELAATEVARILLPGGYLALVTCELTPTPYMNEVLRLMQRSAPRRPRPIQSRRAQLSGVAKIPLLHERRFFDETPLLPGELERVLASISFIGPAMNPERTQRFREQLHAIAIPPVWARTFTLRYGCKRD